MEKLAVLPVIAPLLLFAAVTLVAAQQPPFPLEGGTVEVEYANRIFELSQNPELLQFARMFRETVCASLLAIVVPAAELLNFQITADFAFQLGFYGKQDPRIELPLTFEVYTWRKTVLQAGRIAAIFDESSYADVYRFIQFKVHRVAPLTREI